MFCFVKSVEVGPSVVLLAARPTAFYELLMQRKVKMVFSEHVMCALFCFSSCVLRVLGRERLLATMDSQAAYACSGAPPTKAPPVSRSYGRPHSHSGRAVRRMWSYFLGAMDYDRECEWGMGIPGILRSVGGGARSSRVSTGD